MQKTRDLWTYLQNTTKKILMYGMGNGADKILSICERYGIEVCDFFASDGFVRGHLFHGKRVLSYSEACQIYGKENMIVLLSFASSLPDVLANIYRIAEECELYAPDVPVCGENLFNFEFFKENEDKIRGTELLLADRKSVEVFTDVINYKLSGNVEWIRGDHSDFSDVYRLLGAEKFQKIADLGAYNGDTLREITPFAPNLREAIAFEPDRRNHKKLAEYAEGVEQFMITPLKLAAWSERAILQFDGSGNRNSTLVSDGIAVNKPAKIVEVEADSLDNILGGEPVDYIKFDVEGSEREAILGSLQTIETYRPALMVSLYHRSEDIFELPLMIHERFPDYKFYIRRREYIPAWDTALIAVKQ
ncbi:MAG: FkbM family methyltransferase [Clostridia bacterium]|nr:FkbM family methyltransferase [Clostridia bacterium]